MEPRGTHTTKGSSERGFGLLFIVVFLIIALWPLTGEGGEVRLWALGASAAVAAITALKPSLLYWPNKGWTWIGIALGAIVAPLVMALLFYLVVTPIGLIMRVTGRDPLARKPDPGATSYWITREAQPGPMSRQF